MKRYFVCILCLLRCLFPVVAQVDYNARTEDIIADIYSYLSETQEIDYEELQTLLTDLAANPINLNTATADDLLQLRFLSDRQVDAILLYVYQHQMLSLSELMLIPELQDYEVRNLLPFVYVSVAEQKEPFFWRELFTKAKHEIIARTDVRYAENPKNSGQNDPVYTQLRYKFNFRNQLQLGFTMRRPTGGDARSLLYGGYVQLKRIRCLETLVLGNFQAQFGQGLVCAYPFHTGKSSYVLNAASTPEGLRKYSGVDGGGLHGIGATMRWKQVDVSAWYSLTRENDSVRRHIAGANLTLRLGRWKAGITAMEKIYNDSLHYYHKNARYNQHYFRGNKQFVGGFNLRCNYGIVDAFAEAAMAQNLQKWGYGVLAGVRVSPVADIGLIFHYRYYSPYFDNTVGYAFSETSRINDENGGYIGIEVKRVRHWLFSAYADLFRFSGVKYGIPYCPSWGYDAQAEAAYIPSNRWQTSFRIRAREKAKEGTYSARWRFRYNIGGWALLSEADANIVTDSLHHLTYGLTMLQDANYSFSTVPLTLQMRVQGFYARHWDNRFYIYENDVLYGYSVPALYGEGVRMYLNLRWKIIKQLSLYLRVSETIYTKRWMLERNLSHPTHTDIHLLLRAVI